MIPRRVLVASAAVAVLSNGIVSLSYAATHSATPPTKAFPPTVSELDSSLVTNGSAGLGAFRCPGAPMSFPVAGNATIGWLYREPSTDASGLHSGLDLWAGVNAPVYAIGAGVVTRTAAGKD